jgi:hypothetical protein
MATQNSKRTLLFVLLAVAGVIVVSKLLTNVPGPRPSRAASAEAINLISYVRDMRPGHADFSRSAGSSTVVGNIAGSPDSTGLPVYTGSGAVLTTPWRDRQGRNIAPSLYDASAPEGSTYCLLRQPNIDNQAVVDSWDPLMGPYNVTSAAPAPPLVTSFTMPPVSVPQALSVTPRPGSPMTATPTPC